jgi:hypothetical protein
MTRLTEWILRFLYLAKRWTIDRELHDEATFHIESRSQELQRLGIPVAEALAQARREFGPVIRMQEDSRQTWQFIWLEQLLADLRYACRSLIRDPGVTVVVLSTLALGIGVNTAIFTVTNAVVFQPMPYPKPDQLVVVWQTERRRGSRFVVSAANYLDLKTRAKCFEELAAIQEFKDRDFNLGQHERSEHVSGVKVSAELFSLLGIRPLMGRSLRTDENRPGHNSSVLLGEQLWRSTFGSDPAIVGKTIQLNNTPVMVAGVMPAAFEIPLTKAQIFLPIAWDDKEKQERHISNYIVLGRLQNAYGIRQANAQLSGIAHAGTRIS